MGVPFKVNLEFRDYIMPNGLSSMLSQLLGLHLDFTKHSNLVVIFDASQKKKFEAKVEVAKFILYSHFLQILFGNIQLTFCTLEFYSIFTTDFCYVLKKISIRLTLFFIAHKSNCRSTKTPSCYSTLNKFLRFSIFNFTLCYTFLV